MIVVLEHKHIAEIVEGKFIETQCELCGNGTDQHGHFFFLFNAYVMEFFGAVNKKRAKHEAVLFALRKTPEIWEVCGNDVTVIIFLLKEGFIAATLHKSSEGLLQQAVQEGGTKDQNAD
jgi:hypothetical protein